MLKTSEEGIKLINEILGKENSKVSVEGKENRVDVIKISTVPGINQNITFNDKEYHNVPLLNTTVEHLIGKEKIFKCSTVNLKKGDLGLQYIISSYDQNATYDDTTDFDDNDHIWTYMDFVTKKDLSYGKDEKRISSLSIELYEQIFIKGLFGETPKQSFEIYNQEPINLINKIYRIYNQMLKKETSNGIDPKTLLYLIKDILNTEVLLASEMHKYASIVEETMPLTNKGCLKKRP